jgi:hypothetical protein
MILTGGDVNLLVAVALVAFALGYWYATSVLPALVDRGLAILASVIPAAVALLVLAAVAVIR